MSFDWDSDNTSSTEFRNQFATSSTTQSTPSVSDSSMKSSETAAPSHSETHGIFEDHPWLNPSSERIVELQCAIREKFEALTQDPEREVNGLTI